MAGVNRANSALASCSFRARITRARTSSVVAFAAAGGAGGQTGHGGAGGAGWAHAATRSSETSEMDAVRTGRSYPSSLHHATQWPDAIGRRRGEKQQEGKVVRIFGTPRSPRPPEKRQTR